jgi:hypothetical protein
VVAVAWVVHEGLRARSQLLGARSTLQRAVDDPGALGTPEGRAGAIAQVDGALQAIRSSRRRVARSPIIAVAAAVPGLRSQRAGFLQLIDDSAAAASAGRDLLQRIDGLAAGNQIRDGALPLEAVAELGVQVRAAGEAIGARGQAIGAGGGTSGHLWGPLGRARRQFDEVARSSARRLAEGADALGAARTFLGAGGSRRYLVALQNNAEMRDQGIVLSYVPVSLRDGRLTFEKGGSTNDIPLDRPAPTAVPAGTSAVFGPARPTQRWTAVNASADFAFSGRAMVDMYRQATGQSVDGVIAIDVPGLAALLRVVGPVQVEGRGEAITADNAGQVLLHDFYEGLGPTSDQTARKERLGDVLRVVGDRLTAGSRDAVSLGRELGQAARGGHLRLWSAAPGEEEVFERTGLGGGPGTAEADRTFHVAVENRSGSKLDYYVKPTVRQVVTLTPQGAANVHTTVVVENQAPVGAAPSYALGPDEFTKKPGDYLAWVLLWGPAGSTMPSFTPESGLNLTDRVTLVGAGERKELSFDTLVPDAVREGRLRLRLVPQARLEPASLDVRLEAPGWSVEGSRSWQGPWDTVRTFEWSVRKR